jgi:hypothetical protein
MEVFGSSVLDPDWSRLQSGQWIRIRIKREKSPTKIEKNKEILFFEVLDVLFSWLKALPVA